MFKGLPENRKVMTLRHLRSLVVAYDHLSDEMRRDLTTALEIIKNREVLNMVSEGLGCSRTVWVSLLSSCLWSVYLRCLLGKHTFSTDMLVSCRRDCHHSIMPIMCALP